MSRLFARSPRGLITTRRLPIILAVVVVALLFGVIMAFATPTEIEERITLIDYQQDGKFDYDVYLKPSYLYGTIPLETIDQPPQSTPKYPAAIIDSFDLSFNYRFVSDKPVTQISEEIKVTQRRESPTGQAEETVLVSQNQTGTLTESAVNFSLNTANITAYSRIVIRADVYTMAQTETAPVFESFTQSLTIEPQGSLLVVDRELTQSGSGSIRGVNYEQIGKFDYSVRLKPDSMFGAITLKPPPTPLPAPPTVQKSEKVIFTELVEKMDVTFAYKFAASRPANKLTEEVKITAVLDSLELWSKIFVLVPSTSKSGDFAVTFPLDLEHFNKVIEAIQNEIGVSGESPTLTITADVHTVAETDAGTIDENFKQTLSSTLEGGTLKWNEELAKSQPGAIERTRLMPNPKRLLGLSVDEARIVFPALTGVFFILFLYVLAVYIRLKPVEVSPINEEARRAKKKFKRMIVDVSALPPIGADEKVIRFDSVEELATAADALLKPVLHLAEADKHTYCVIDGLIRYEYVSKLEPSDNVTDLRATVRKLIDE